VKTLVVAVLAFSLSGCFIVSKKPAQNKQSSTVQPKNHGQERSQEVHERNEARKEAKDQAKGK